MVLIDNFMECALFRKDYDGHLPILSGYTSCNFMECALFRKDYDRHDVVPDKAHDYLYGMCLV